MLILLLMGENTMSKYYGEYKVVVEIDNSEKGIALSKLRTMSILQVNTSDFFAQVNPKIIQVILVRIGEGGIQWEERK